MLFYDHLTICLRLLITDVGIKTKNRLHMPPPWIFNLTSPVLSASMASRVPHYPDSMQDRLVKTSMSESIACRKFDSDLLVNKRQA